METQRVWQNVAVVITNSQQDTIQRNKVSTPDLNSRREKDRQNVDHLEKIPHFGLDSLTLSTYEEVHNYLIKAFESSHHPLGTLLTEVAAAYTATYGGVRVHPLLLSHAVAELHSITSRVYYVVTLLFPALPPEREELVLETEDGEDRCESNRQLHRILISDFSFSARLSAQRLFFILYYCLVCTLRFSYCTRCIIKRRTMPIGRDYSSGTNNRILR